MEWAGGVATVGFADLGGGRWTGRRTGLGRKRENRVFGGAGVFFGGVDEREREGRERREGLGFFKKISF